MGEKTIYVLTRSDVTIENNAVITSKTNCIICNSLKEAREEMAEQLADIREFESKWQGDNIGVRTNIKEDRASVMYHNRKNTHGYLFQIEGKTVKGREINDDDVWEIYDTEPYFC